MLNNDGAIDAAVLKQHESAGGSGHAYTAVEGAPNYASLCDINREVPSSPATVLSGCMCEQRRIGADQNAAGCISCNN
jgi:hypothetical protein